ncbi:MAG: cache domain-containing protein [Sulfurovum sp.]|nr:cache domain-containing protein [Sulfurovum sp.]
MFRSKILRKFLIAMLVLVAGYLSVILLVALPRVDTVIKSLEEKNAKEVLEKVVLLTEHAGKNLESFRQTSLLRHKKEMKNIVDVVHSMLKETYRESYIVPERREALKQDILEKLRHIRYGGNNYLFVLDYNATMLSHPYITAGKDMSRIADMHGKLIAPSIVNVAREKGEGYTSYWWMKDNDDKTPYEKLTYSRNCPMWKMVIATGVYIDDIQKEVARRKKELFQKLRDIMEKTKIGKTGYIYIFDEDKMIIHPNSNIDGMNFKTLPNPGRGTFIYDDLVKAAKGTGVLRYKWDKPDDKGHYVYEKISWVRYVPSLKLYVASSVYIDELEEESRRVYGQMIYLTFFVLIISLILGIWYLYRQLRPIHQLSDTAQEIADGNYAIRADVSSDDEVGLLANNFNRMVDRLEEQIVTLDRKIQEKTEALQKLAITDALTQLYNRRYFSEISVEMFHLGKRNREPLSVIMFDIDMFKHINDTYGHQVGDKVIVVLSTLVGQIKRASDIACRYGGEEFILLLPKTDRKGAFELAERLRKVIEDNKIVLEDGTVVKFTVSLGVSQVDYENDKDIEDVIRRADDAMYIAKRDGRNKTREL